ncbi:MULTISPECIES: glycosyltransferase family 2 protein [unclassified Salinibacterium]|uniref:glycosyltransferase family 2 protein n=1 Tax=unclassified Salinibacterium TaxID=2632331 RepID=UPI00143CF941|nr:MULTISPECIES: glycosyltransferase family 2 protein [unclassified Salinibacterium]
MNARLGIIVVNFGSHSLLDENFGTLDLDRLNAVLIVVDNFSSTEERRAITALARIHGWHLEGGPNVGFGAGVNHGVARARDLGCDAFIAINPDARADVAALAALAEHARQHPLALVAPTITGTDGGHWFAGGTVLVRGGRTTTAPGTDSSEPGGWLTGACLAFSDQLWQATGGFDDRYFLYWEDVDLSWRCVAAGGHLIVRPDIRITHSIGGTQLAAGTAKSATYYYYNCRNRLLFAASHLSKADALRWLLLSPDYARRVMLRGGKRQFLHNPWRPVWASARGSLAGIRALLASGGARATGRRDSRDRVSAGWLVAVATLVLTGTLAPVIARALDSRGAPQPTSERVAPSPSAPSPAPAPAAPAPAAPGPGNTGVPTGIALSRFDGDLVITSPGAVIDSLDIHGFVRVEAPDVIIRNTIIRGREAASSAILLFAGSPAAKGLLVHDSELVASHPSPIVGGVYGYGFTLRRVEIQRVVDSVHIFGDNVLIEESWLHDNLHFTHDPAWNGGPSHDDSVQVQSGSDIVIRGNTISGAYNAALQITQDRGVTSHVTFSDNRVSGGGCTVNVAEKGRGPIAGLNITGNSFGASRLGCTMLLPPSTEAHIADNTTTDGSTVRIDRRAQ